MVKDFSAAPQTPLRWDIWTLSHLATPHNSAFWKGNWLSEFSLSALPVWMAPASSLDTK